MTYTIILRNEDGNEIERNYHEAVITDREFIGEAVESMKDSLESNF